MIVFLQASLGFFAFCAALGIIPCAVLAAKAGKPSMILVAFAVALWICSVLGMTAGLIS